MFGNTGFIQACGRTEVAVFRSAFNNRFLRRREEGKRERERERERRERDRHPRLLDSAHWSKAVYDHEFYIIINMHQFPKTYNGWPSRWTADSVGFKSWPDFFNFLIFIFSLF
jgi:hypothetical protein